MPRLAAHLVAHAERVDDRLLRALDHRLVKWVAGLVEQDVERGGHLGGLARDAVGGGEGDDDLARAVRGERARAADAERGALAEAHQLRRQERRVGGDDRDDRAGVALAPRRRVGRLQHLADRRAVDAQRAHHAEVRLHQDPDGVVGPLDADPARAGADAGLEVAGDEAGPGADRALGHLAGRRLLDGAVDVLGADVAADGVVQPGVVALADQRDHHVVLAADLGPLLGHPLDRGVRDLADRHGVGEQDRRLQEAPLLDLRDPRDLAGAVQDEAAGDHPALEDVGVGDDGGDAGAHGALADLQRAVADDQRRVSDLDAGDVGDGVRFADREAADGEAELAEPLPHSGAGVDGGPPAATAGPGVLSVAAAVAVAVRCRWPKRLRWSRRLRSPRCRRCRWWW